MCLQRVTLQTHITRIVIDCHQYGRRVIFVKEDCLNDSSVIPKVLNRTGFCADNVLGLCSEAIRIESRPELLAILIDLFLFSTSSRTSQESKLLSDGMQESSSKSVATNHSCRI
jgi:hypothetical protein